MYILYEVYYNISCIYTDVSVVNGVEITDPKDRSTVAFFGRNIYDCRVPRG